MIMRKEGEQTPSTAKPGSQRGTTAWLLLASWRTNSFESPRLCWRRIPARGHVGRIEGPIMSRMSHARQAIGGLISKRCDRKMKTTSTGPATGDHERLVERYEDIPNRWPRSAGYG